MSLTLEEKQRLAKEQEQAAKLRNQQPLAPQTVKPATTTNTQVQPGNISVYQLKYMTMIKFIVIINLLFLFQTKDLTSSLLNNMTSLNSMSLANTSRPAAAQGTTMSAFPSSTPMVGSMGAPISNGFNQPMGFQAGGMGMGMHPTGPGLYGGMATTTSTPNFGTLTQNQGSTPQANKTNMSALDNLFTSSKPKVTLNQMGPIPAPGNNTPWLSQLGSAQNTQTQMQGVAVGMGGVPGGFGMQANPFFSPQNFPQPAASAPTMNPSGIKHSTSVNNDLKDLFG